MASQGAPLYNNIGNNLQFTPNMQRTWKYHFYTYSDGNQEVYFRMVQEIKYLQKNGYIKVISTRQPFTHEQHSNTVYHITMCNGIPNYQYSSGRIPEYYITTYGAIPRQNNHQFAKYHPGNIEYHPLMDTHEYGLFCCDCFPIHNDYSFKTHRCRRSILAFVEKGTPYWYRVREYTNRDGYLRFPEPCRRLCLNSSGTYNGKEERCAFAHNHLEIKLWQEEIQGKFNVRDYIEKQRRKGCDINYIISTYGETFEFICDICLERNEISKASPDNPHECSGSIPHYWEGSKILQCVTKGGPIKIKKPFNVKRNTFYLLCNLSSCYLSSGKRRLCTYAHSEVERDIWRLERDQGFTQERLEAFSKALKYRNPSGNIEQAAMYNIGINDLDIPTRNSDLKLNFQQSASLRFHDEQNKTVFRNHNTQNDKQSNHRNNLKLRSNDISSNITLLQTSPLCIPRSNREYSGTSDVSPRVILFQNPTSASKDRDANSLTTGFNNGSLSSSCNDRLNNGEYTKSNELSSQVTLLRRTPVSSGDNGLCTGSDNETSHISVLQEIPPAYNGNTGEDMESNVASPNVTLLRRSPSATENRENQVKCIITNETLIDTPELQKSTPFIENTATNNVCMAPNDIIDHRPLIVLEDVLNSIRAMALNDDLPDISVVERLSSDSEDELCNINDIIDHRPLIVLEDVLNSIRAMALNDGLPDISVVERLSSDSEDELCNTEDIKASKYKSSRSSMSEESSSESERECYDYRFTASNLVYQKSSSLVCEISGGDYLTNSQQ